MAVTVEILRDEALQRHLTGLARLRIEVFREWPYLYDGSFDYERDYLRAFAQAAGAVIVGAFDGAELVGASTAAPLAAQADYIVAPFRSRGIALHEYFYFGESVLRRAYRDQGLGVRFFAAREAAARDVDGIKATTFCAVVRTNDDLRTPRSFRPLDGFWRRRGYDIWRGMTCEISWAELGATEETQHQMQFWRKELT